MSKGYPVLTPEQKQEIVSRIKEKGERVVVLAKEYGVKPRTIYDYLSRSTSGNSSNLLELAKIKRPTGRAQSEHLIFYLSLLRFGAFFVYGDVQLSHKELNG